MDLVCPHCLVSNSSSESRKRIVGSGSFRRKSDLTRQARYLCRPCQKTFSTATTHPCRNQKKRHLNPEIYQYLVSGVSQRRLARVMRINRKTVVRKFLFLGLCAYQIFLEHRRQQSPSEEIEFDDLETFEHSKLKPLSVTMAVETQTRRILGFRVAKMPAKGHLVQRAFKKYGKRQDQRKSQRQALFRELRPYLKSQVVIKSDENPHYGPCVRKYFPKSLHQVYKGRRGCVVGQGELKAGGFDPLFSLNHSFAMLRANINRLFRRTWNTTKKPERLAIHIMLYTLYHNLELIKKPEIPSFEPVP